MTILEQILITVITAFATAILAYLGFWRQAQAELYKDHKTKFNEKKWEVYTTFTSMLPILVEINRLVEIKHYNKKLSPEDETRLEDLPKCYKVLKGKAENDTLLIGSKNVVEYYLEWESRTFFNNAKDEYVVEILIKLINAMREDLGEEKSNIDFKSLDGLYYISNEKRKQQFKPPED